MSTMTSICETSRNTCRELASQYPHVALGVLERPQTQREAQLITNPAHQLFVSAVSHWEIAIKLSTMKLQIRESFTSFLQTAIFDNGFSILPVETKHTAELIALPYHHKDPFDRLLIAQAIAERMPIISNDAIFDCYPIQRVW